MEYFAEPSFHPPTAKMVFNLGFIFFNALNLPKLSEMKIIHNEYLVRIKKCLLTDFFMTEILNLQYKSEDFEN